MSEPQQNNPPTRPARDHVLVLKVRWRLIDWFWFILKNVLGWILILASFIVGPAVPGPGGIPLFLIGFGLITFPGKRRFTARILRGRPVDTQSPAYRLTLAAVAIILPAILIYLLFGRLFWRVFIDQSARNILLGVLYFASATIILVFGVRGVSIINAFLRGVARGRRRVRPYLRKKGLDLLPPRRKRRILHALAEPDEEIIEIHERHFHRLTAAWDFCRPWLMRILRIALVAAIFTWMLKPVVRQWPDVKTSILALSAWHFIPAVLMFVVFLFAFRSLAWRRVLGGFGHWLPVPVTTRIWISSELARYIPGAIWQVVGRVYLIRPYGVSAAVSSASQILDVAIFVLANVLVALTCLLIAGMRRIPPDQRHLLLILLALIPVLLTLLHPRVFYGLLNAVLRRLGRNPVEQALRKRQIAWLVGWLILGLLWQSLAIWLLTHASLGLPLEKWYVLAGTYCLAWTIGFSVGFLFPGGLGMREAVFITTLPFVLPQHAFAESLQDPAVQRAFLGFLVVLLRLWTICGELILAGLAILADRRGAAGHPDAPGRKPPANPIIVEP